MKFLSLLFLISNVRAEDNGAYQIQSRDGHCLVTNSAKYQVGISKCQDDTQEFNIEKNSDGSYSLRDKNKCLGVKKEAAIVILECFVGPYQKWSMKESRVEGGKVFENVGSHKCITIRGFSVMHEDCGANNRVDQAFFLKKPGPNSTSVAPQNTRTAK